jgi:hypothetical protein
MSTLFEKCVSCGKQTPGSLFCSDQCRLGASLARSVAPREQSKKNSPPSLIIPSGPVGNGLESLTMEEHTARSESAGVELAQYEDSFARRLEKRNTF